MYFKKTIVKYLKILTAILLIYFVFLHTNIYRVKYEKIDQVELVKITTVINRCKGTTPNLQTDRINAKWNDEAFNLRKDMMDKVLDSLNVLGETNDVKPKHYIIANYKDNLYLYIAYNKTASYKNIIIEANGHYYVAAANKGAVTDIVDFMREQVMKYQ